jgi:hypothetical protein
MVGDNAELAVRYSDASALTAAGCVNTLISQFFACRHARPTLEVSLNNLKVRQ